MYVKEMEQGILELVMVGFSAAYYIDSKSKPFNDTEQLIKYAKRTANVLLVIQK
jgi:hypothetical protein